MNLASCIQPSKIKPEFCVPFNFRVLGGQVLVISDLGDWLFLSPDEFTAFIEGRPAADEPLYERLKDKNLIAAEIDKKAVADRWQRENKPLFHGPSLHTLALTSRSNQACRYSGAASVGMDATDTDMTVAIAERAIDLAFQTTSPTISIALRGGEPLANWEVLQHAVEYARQKNALAGKGLSLSVQSNLALLDDEKLSYLVDRRVQISTRLDGPADLHDALNPWADGSAHAKTTEWIAKINKAYADLNLDADLYRVPVTVTLARPSLGRVPEIVAQLVAVGARSVRLQRLDTFGLPQDVAAELGISMDEFLAAFSEAVELLIEANRKGTRIAERHAGTMLAKLLGESDPSDLGLRTPGTSCIGQLAYGADGRVFSSEEGRLCDVAGDPMFEIGTVTSSYQSLVSGGGTRAFVMAGLQDSQPDCVNCVYKPLCGQQVEGNYKTQGSLHGRMRDSSWCKQHKTLFDGFTQKLRDASEADRALLRRWAEHQTLEHFMLQREAL